MRRIASFSRQSLITLSLLLIALFIGVLLFEAVRTDDAPIIIRDSLTPTVSTVLNSTEIPVVDFSTVIAPTLIPQGSNLYVIEAGDTLYGIALQYGTTIEAIIAANPNLPNPDNLDVGQEIRLPSP